MSHECTGEGGPNCRPNIRNLLRKTSKRYEHILCLESDDRIAANLLVHVHLVLIFVLGQTYYLWRYLLFFLYRLRCKSVIVLLVKCMLENIGSDGPPPTLNMQ